MKHFSFSNPALSVSIFFLLFPIGVWAEGTGGGLSVEPVFQEISFEAKDVSADFFVTLHNTTATAVVLRPSVVDFGSLDESGGVAFLGQSKELERKYALASWMRLEKDVVSLKPDETERLHVVIENRDSLSPGGHYGAILFKVGSEDDTTTIENTVAVNQLISVLVFAKKKGGETYDLKLVGKEWSKNLFFPLKQLRLRLQSAGNVHVVPRGVVTVTDPIGRVVSKGSINPESGLILPETLRTYTTTLLTLTQALIPGKYTLLTAYRYDGKEEFITEREQFLLFPWQGVAGVLLLGIVTWYGKRLAQKRRLLAIKK